MKLIYQNNLNTVRIGDVTETFIGDRCTVISIVKPHKSNSSGLVYLQDKCGRVIGFYPAVINAFWKE